MKDFPPEYHQARALACCIDEMMQSMSPLSDRLRLLTNSLEDGGGDFQKRFDNLHAAALLFMEKWDAVQVCKRAIDLLQQEAADRQDDEAGNRSHNAARDGLAVVFKKKEAGHAKQG